jgi:hypothetical protein
MNMLNNPYVLNCIVSLVSTLVLYLLCRTDEKPCSWKVYLKHLILVFMILVSIDYIKPLIMKGGSGSVSQPEVNIGNPDF